MSKPEVIDRGRFGPAVRWPDGFESAMPNAATAKQCAAAPELLMQLRIMVNKWKALAESGDAGTWDTNDDPDIQQANAVIAKATS